MHYTILYNIIFYSILFYSILLYCIIFIVYYMVFYYTILYYTILYYTILYYTIRYYTILCYATLCYDIPYYTVHCTSSPREARPRKRGGKGHLLFVTFVMLCRLRIRLGPRHMLRVRVKHSRSLPESDLNVGPSSLSSFSAPSL